jgi:hypothetical protein
MWDFELGRAIGLMARTAPFIGLRMAIYFGITLAYIIATGGGGGIGYLIGSSGDPESAASAAFWGASAGFGLVSGVLYFAREYLLYMVKAGHIAVLVPLLDNQPIPEGRNQITHATAVVKERFVESSVLFGVDQLIKGILRAFNATVLTISAILPIPALQNVMKFVTAVINMSLTYVDEVILAYNIRTQQQNPWAGARDGVVLYAQNYKNLLKNALWLTIFVWLLTLLVFILVFAPVAALVALFPGAAGFWTFAIAVITAYAIKAALIDPIAMTCLMQAFFKATEGQQPRQEWADKLNGVSGKFQELGQRALRFAGGPRATAQTLTTSGQTP